jgi:hypothetical protein
MARARETARSTPSKRLGSKLGEGAHSATTGQFILVQAGEVVAHVPVSKARFQRIMTKKRVLGKVISGYADAAAKAKRTGKDYIIAYRVSPDGKAVEVGEPRAEAPAGGSLGAAIAQAKARGATKVSDILKGADMLTARAFGDLIGASHETVNTRRKRHEVLGLEGATRGVKYPRWQVTDAGLPLPGLVQLFHVLGEQPWTVYRFLRTAHAELGGSTALDALKAGQVDAVVGAAENQAAGAFS